MIATSHRTAFCRPQSLKFLDRCTKPALEDCVGRRTPVCPTEANAVGQAGHVNAKEISGRPNHMISEGALPAEAQRR
jgi:hypothetical protein